MKISFDKYPVDIIICIILSIILIPITLLNIDNYLRIIIGLPFILFIPGYILVFTLFPNKKKDRSIDSFERVALSFGLSIAIVPLIGLGLNYTPWGIRLEPILFTNFAFIVFIGVIGIFRWFNTKPEERFIISLKINLPENRVDKALSIILAIVIIVTICSLIYVIMIPKTGEKFTEFYLLGPDGKATDYPRNLTLNENTSVIIGLVNHEYKTINYTVDIWLVNQTFDYNETSNINETVYHNLWFMDKININLDHIPINVEGPWSPQWEYNYTFNIDINGEFKLIFLLYKESTKNYDLNFDYKDIAKQKLDSTYSKYYEELHLWINIK